MKRRITSRISLLAAVASALLAPALYAASPVATYLFNGDFHAAEAGLPDLTPVDPLGTSAFVTDAPLGQRRPVWAFDGASSPPAQQAGLTVSTEGLIEPRSYSVDFVAKFTQRAGAYRRLIDVRNRQDDSGFYVDPSNNLDVYPAAGTSAAWTNDVYHHVVLTNDGVTVHAYLDGVSQFTSTTNLLDLDSGTDNPSRLLTFFLDNVAGGGQGEWSAGSVALIRLWNGVLTAEEAQTLARNPFAGALPSLTITSPPAGLSLVSGEIATVTVSAPDPDHQLSVLQFALDGAAIGAVAAPGPYALNFTVSAPGAHVLVVTGTGVDGRQSAQTLAFESAAADASAPAPSAAILTAADGRALAAGSTFVLTASAFSNLPNELLDRVEFYADGTLFARFDGVGAPLDLTAAAGRLPVRAESSAAPSGSVFKAPFQMPGVNKLVNMVIVALTKTRLAHVSAPISVRSVANASDRPPAVRIGGLANGARLKVSGQSLNVAVEVSDPDAAVSRANRRGPARRAFDTSPLIASVQYYLNALLVKDSKEAPFTLPFTPSAPGSYVLTAVATDGAGLSTISDPVQVEVTSPPTVSVAVKGSSLLQEGGGKGKVEFTRDGDTAEDLTVAFKLKGTAISGVDYRTIERTLTIPAGSATAKLKIKPLDDGQNRGSRSLKVQVIDAADGTYVAGTAGKAKLTLLDND